METKLRLGVIQGLANVDEELRKVREMGMPTCQVGCWDPNLYTEENVTLIMAASRKYDVEVTTIWAGYSGPDVWDFLKGPITIGLVPPEYRKQRIEDLKKGADFAAKAKVPSITTHAGFIPEDLNNPLYQATITALREVAKHCKSLGLYFCLETGQETPITLLRAIKDIGTDNMGVNFDPANLLMYGKANPVDALDILGPYVKGVHAKDGEYPTDPLQLGVEKPLGEGRVNFPAFIPKLKSFGYTGALTIEREISGPRQIEDIKRAIEMLKELL